MYERWGRALKTGGDLMSLAVRLRELDNETLTRMLIQAMPERLAYISAHAVGGGHGPEAQYLDPETGAQYMRIGRSSIANAGGRFLIPLATTGKANDVITTAHTLTAEQAVQYFPSKVRFEAGELYVDASTGRVLQNREIRVEVDYPGSNQIEWETIGRDAIPVKDAVAEAFLAAERHRAEAASVADKERLTNIEQLKSTAQARLELLFSVLQQILDNTKAGSSRTSTEKRLAQLKTIQDQLNAGTVADPSATDRQIDQYIHKVTILAKRVAKENGWSGDWVPVLQKALDRLSSAIKEHVFAQEVIRDGTPAAEIERRTREYILHQGMVMAQKGQEIEPDKIIDTILDEIVRS